MDELPHISEAEWVVMRLLWSQAPLNSNQIVEALQPETGWHPKTIRTLLNRLMKKKAVTITKEGRLYWYTARLTEAECARIEGRSFLQRVYGGALKPMLVSFLEDGHLSPDELAELRRILDAKRRR